MGKGLLPRRSSRQKRSVRQKRIYVLCSMACCCQLFSVPPCRASTRRLTSTTQSRSEIPGLILRNDLLLLGRDSRADQPDARLRSASYPQDSQRFRLRFSPERLTTRLVYGERYAIFGGQRKSAYMCVESPTAHLCSNSTFHQVLLYDECMRSSFAKPGPKGADGRTREMAKNQSGDFLKAVLYEHLEIVICEGSCDESSTTARGGGLPVNAGDRACIPVFHYSTSFTWSFLNWPPSILLPALCTLVLQWVSNCACLSCFIRLLFSSISSA